MSVLDDSASKPALATHARHPLTRYMAATLTSSMGNTAHTLAAANVFVLAGRPALVPVLMLVSTLCSALFAVVVARFIHEVSPRKSLLFVDGLSGGVVVLLCVAITTSGSPIPCIFAAEVLLTVGSAVYFPASRTFIPHLVDKEALAGANAGLGSVYQFGAVFGGVVGLGVIRLFGPVTGFAVNAVSYLVSFFLIAAIPCPERRVSIRQEEPGGAIRHGGLRALLADADTLTDMAVMISFLCMFEVFNALGPGLTAYHFHRPPSDFGLLQAVFAVGSLLAVPLLPRFTGRHRSAMHLLLPLTGLLVVALAVAGWPIALAMVVVAGITFQGWTSFQTRMQHRLAQGEANRVLALAGGAQKVCTSLTFAAAAVLTQTVGVALGMTIPVLALLLVTLPFGVVAHRRHQHPPVAPSAPEVVEVV
jgi:hypothetical protein